MQGKSTHTKTIRSIEVKGLSAEETVDGTNKGCEDRGTESRLPEDKNEAQPLPICGYLGWRSPCSGGSWTVPGVRAGIAGTIEAKPGVLQAGSRVHTSQWNCRAAVVTSSAPRRLTSA